VAQAVKPAEPRFISAFFSFPGDSSPSATTNESWINCGDDFPHVWAEGKRLLVTWHLYGSLPHALYPPPNQQNARQAFVWMDRYLDSARGGPLYWKRPLIAQLVVDSIHYGAQHLQYYELEAFVVMANHCTCWCCRAYAPGRFLQTLKGYTAREANRLLGRTGQPFWQAESYDHVVRDDRESDRIQGYIENNPVKAGLVANAEDHFWSSAARKAEMNLGSAGSTACATKLSE
jgi:REP element-mobilizing transposase RayT